MLDDDCNNLIVINKSGHIQFANGNSQLLMIRNSLGNPPNNFFKLIFDKDLDKFRSFLNEALKIQKMQHFEIGLKKRINTIKSPSVSKLKFNKTSEDK